MDMYQQASAACEVVKRNNVAIAKALPDKITRHRQLERRKAQHQLLNDQNDRSSDLDKERAWALIRDKEKVIRLHDLGFSCPGRRNSNILGTR